METKQKGNSRLFILMFLGLMSAFGPFVMDMYLPTLPAMADFFHTTSSAVQLGLTASMVGLAAGQLVFGPLSDRYGRRRPLFVAMTLFLLSTLGCIFAQSIFQFVALRLVQGIAGAGGVVISRSVAADRYSAHELAGMLAVIGAVNGVATVAAPITGGVLAGIAGWQGIFWLLFLLGVFLLACTVKFEESLPAGRRPALSWTGVCSRFFTVLRNRQYVFYILQYGFTMGVLFVNISSAPFIMQEHYGLSPMAFSLCFGINAVAMMAASALAAKFPSMEGALRVGSIGMLLAASLLFVGLNLKCGVWVYEILVFALLSMVGMTFTASNALAMDSERQNAGVASALLGAVGYVAGGIVSPLVGVGDVLQTTGLLFLCASFCAYMCACHATAHSVPLHRMVSYTRYALCRIRLMSKLGRK